MVNWNSAADQRLLAVILSVHQLTLDYTKVAEGFGQDVTPKAISQHIAKIKKAGTAAPENDASTGTSGLSLVKTPQKPRARVLDGRVAKKKPANKRGVEEKKDF
jgi:hypothetical protein